MCVGSSVLGREDSGHRRGEHVHEPIERAATGDTNTHTKTRVGGKRHHAQRQPTRGNLTWPPKALIQRNNKKRRRLSSPTDSHLCPGPKVSTGCCGRGPELPELPAPPVLLPVLPGLPLGLPPVLLPVLPPVLMRVAVEAVEAVAAVEAVEAGAARAVEADEEDEDDTAEDEGLTARQTKPYAKASTPRKPRR